MSDKRLRELEREAAAGSIGSAARLLLERERAGHRSPLQCPAPVTDHNPLVWVSKAKKAGRKHMPCKTCDGTGFLPFVRAIELAAILGDPSSRLALGWGRFHGPDCTHETVGPDNEYITHVRKRGCLFLSFTDLAKELYQDGGTPLLVRAVLPLLDLFPKSPDTDGILKVANEWLQAPNEAAREAIGSKSMAPTSRLSSLLPKHYAELALLIYWPATGIHTVDPMYKWARAHLIFQAAVDAIDVKAPKGNGLVRTMLRDTIAKWVLA